MKHILIDYENVQPNDFDLITNKEEIHIWLFLGIHQQKTLPYCLIKSLFDFHRENVHFIEMQHAGKNALDHYLAFYLGKISTMDNDAQVCILAKDSGYDVLVQHLNHTYQNLQVFRLTDIYALSETVIPQKSQTHTITSIDNKQSANNLISTSILDNLNKISTTFISQCFRIILIEIMKENAYLPSRLTNLQSAMKKYALKEEIKELTEQEINYLIDELLKKLKKNELIEIKNGQVIYKLSANDFLNSIKNHVINSKPKTIDKLKNVIKNRLIFLNQSSNEPEINLVIKWLKTQNILKQKNTEILFDNFDTHLENNNSNINNELQLTAKNIIKNIEKSKRPKKITALQNCLKSQLKNDNMQTIQQITQSLIKAKQITINENNKITYNF